MTSMRGAGVETFDVVVIGGGGSGLAAAVSAAESGASVVLLEKAAQAGGTTSMSVGVVTSSCTVNQAQQGIADSAADHYDDMALFNRKYTDLPDNDGLRRVLADNLPETVRWLSSMGVQFYGPTPEAPHRQPRMHNALPGPRAYIHCLTRRAQSLGVSLRVGSPARRLLMTDGRVSGVEYQSPDGETRQIRTAKAVVLASGDYSASPEMKSRFISEQVANMVPVNPSNTGDGQRMGMELGGRVINGAMFLGGARFVRPRNPSWISRIPPSPGLMKVTGLLLRYIPVSIVRRFVMGFLTSVLVPSHHMFECGAILVNRRGERFADELKKLIFEISDQPDGEAYIVMDDNIASKFRGPPHEVSTAPGFAFAYLGDYERNRPDIFHSGETPEALARSMGVDPEGLMRAMRSYNADVDARHGRPTLDTPPFVALGPVKNYVNFTDGGLAISERLEVLGADGVPIPGLYAVGSAGQGGLLLKGHGHHLGWVFTSGRLAGRYAAGKGLS